MMPSAQSNPATLCLLVREGCHLCEDMQAQLFEFAPELNFSFRTVDIDDSPYLLKQYNDAVPVLLMGETEICRYFLDLMSLRNNLDWTSAT